MSGRACIRRCRVHLAACPDFGKRRYSECVDCPPRECRDRSYLCDGCFGRMKGLLHDAPDMLGRLRAIADPAKSGWNWDQVVISSGASTTAPPPIGDDLADAIIAIEQALTGWLAWNGDLAWISNNLDAVTWMSARVLDVHRPDEHGVREGWSVLDAVKRWGVERRDPNQAEWEDDDDRVEIVTPVHEDDENPIISRAEAEGIAGSARTLQRWIKDGAVVPVGTTYIAGVMTRLFRRAELVDARERMQGRMNAGRPKRSK